MVNERGAGVGVRRGEGVSVGASGITGTSVCRGAQIGEGRKSLAYRVTFTAPDRALTDAELTKVRERIARSPATDSSRLVLAACYGQLGKIDEARSAWSEITLARWIRSSNWFRGQSPVSSPKSRKSRRTMNTRRPCPV